MLSPHEEAGATKRPSRARPQVAAALFAGVFVALTWFPPGPEWGDGDAATGFARMFPGVPATWVAARLISLLIAVFAVVAWIRDAAPRSPPATRSQRFTEQRTEPGFAPAALIFAIAQLALAPYAGRLGPAGQAAYVAGLFVPATLFALGSAHIDSASAGRRATLVRAAASLPVLLVVGAWTALRRPATPPDPRAASLVDCWACWETLERAAAPSFNVLTDGPLPGLTSLHLFFDGAGIFGRLAAPPSLRGVALAHLAALAIGALAAGAAARRRLGADAAPVAAAALLFSPYVLAAPLNPCAVHFGAAAAGILLWLYVRSVDDGRAWSLAALGACGGIAATHPAVAPTAVVLAATAAFLVPARSRRVSAAWLAGACSFAAATIPALPSPAELQVMLERYVGWSQGWVGIERILLGQQSIVDVPSYWNVPAPTWEIVAGAALAPFQAPRTPLRLLGDTWFDPLTSLAAAVALMLAAATLLRRRSAGPVSPLALVLVAVATLPALATSFDRPSLVRMLCLPAAMAWAAACGYAAILQRAANDGSPRDRTARRSPLALQRPVTTALLTAVMAASGIAIFDHVNPSILPASATSIAIETLQGPGAPQAVLLEHDGSREGDDQERLDWMYVDLSTRQLAAERLRALAVADRGRLDIDDRLLLWSPGLEVDAGIRERVCGRRPDDALFTILDRSGLSRLYAAAPAALDWTPALPRERWTRQTCTF